jgi:hypothetical protein
VSSRTRIGATIVVLVVLVIAGIVTNASSPDVQAAVDTGPRVDAAGEGTTWYCAEGTANPGGRGDEEISIGNVDRVRLRAVVTVDGGSEVAPVARPYTVEPGRVVRVHVADLAPIADPGVVVETQGGRAVVEHTLTRAGDTAMGPCAREPSTEARFAAGTTSKGSELWLALFNPFPDDAIVDVEAVTDAGRRAPVRLQGIVVPRLTRVSVPIHEDIQRVDTVATQVSVRRGRVIAEQSQFLDGSDQRRGLGLSLGSELATSWRFPIGVSGSGRQDRIVLANPSGRDAQVTVSFALDAAAAVEPVRLVLPATSVVSPDLSRVPGDIPYSARVRSSVPIVAESVGAFGAPQAADVRGIAIDPGFVTGARVWAVVPSRLGTQSTDSLALVATDGRRHRARVVVRGPDGDQVLATAAVPAVGRVVIEMPKVTRRPNLALLVLADGPVVVARESVRPGLTRSHAVPG